VIKKLISYDFLTWKSFPSSLKIRKGPTGMERWDTGRMIAVNPGDVVTYEVKVKGTNVGRFSFMQVYPKEPWKFKHQFINLPHGIYEWTMISQTTLPAGTDVESPIGIQLVAGNAYDGVNDVEVWFDDLKVYVNDRLVYENTFDNWLPYIIGGGGIVTVVGVAGVTKLMKIW